ncbi:auxin-responsive protein IAA26-like [Aristolochia californica]|uniref:auxin-responsive protein IAA26-like n=1 Tax=Aristolochia californica TaxID=171875 RepID=UPI0035DCD7CF
MGVSSNRDGSCKHFLDLVPNGREWMVREKETFGVPEDRKLELRLAPPGDWAPNENASNRDKDDSLLSLGCFANPSKNNTAAGAKRGFVDTEGGHSSGNQNQKLSSGVSFTCSWSSSSPSHSTIQKAHQHNSAFLPFQTGPKLPALGQEALQANGAKAELLNHEKKAYSTASPSSASNPSQTRGTSGPVVGWPPIRSFRKNIASSSSKPALESQNGAAKAVEKLPEQPVRKGLFVKINMDGVPIGRKVDLKAYDSYEKLSCAVDELFRGLLAAQEDSSIARSRKDTEERVAISGLLDGTGEYTLVYEDNEGDRMLVGDVPWVMFVSTVKRLRVLKSSELSALSLGSSKQHKLQSAGVVR